MISKADSNALVRKFAMGIALVLEAKVIVKPLSCSLSRFRQLNEKLCNLNYFNVFLVLPTQASTILPAAS